MDKLVAHKAELRIEGLLQPCRCILTSQRSSWHIFPPDLHHSLKIHLKTHYHSLNYKHSMQKIKFLKLKYGKSDNSSTFQPSPNRLVITDGFFSCLLFFFDGKVRMRPWTLSTKIFFSTFLIVFEFWKNMNLEHVYVHDCICH